MAHMVVTVSEGCIGLRASKFLPCRHKGDKGDM